MACTIKYKLITIQCTVWEKQINISWESSAIIHASPVNAWCLEYYIGGREGKDQNWSS